MAEDEYKTYANHLDALNDLKPGEVRDVRIGKTLVTIKKGDHQEHESLYQPSTPKAKVILPPTGTSVEAKKSPEQV